MIVIKKIFEFILDEIFPITIIIIAVIVSLNPKIGNFVFDTNTIMLSLFSLLAIDLFLDKIKTKKKISNKIEYIDSNIDTIKNETLDMSKKMSTWEENNILKKRSDFERLEHIFMSVKNDLFVSGINLEGIVPSCSIIKELAQKGVHIKLLMLNPDGKKLVASSDMSGVTNTERKKKIKANLEFLKREFKDEIQSNQIEIRTIDAVLPISFIGIDIEKDYGQLIVQNYLYKTPSSKSLMLLFTNRQLYWYNLYIEQLNLIWENGK